MNKPNKQINVVIGCILKNGLILVGDRFEAGMEEVCKINLPGGKVEAGETPGSALKREITEEVGLDVSIVEKIPFDHVNIWEYPLFTQHTTVSCYTCDVADEALTAVFQDSDKDKNWRWVEFDDVDLTKTLPGISKFLKWVRERKI